MPAAIFDLSAEEAEKRSAQTRKHTAGRAAAERICL